MSKALTVPLNFAQQSASHLNVEIGYPAILNERDAQEFPVKNGKIIDWGLMESFWGQCLYQYLRADPNDTPVIVVHCPYFLN